MQNKVKNYIRMDRKTDRWTTTFPKPELLCYFYGIKYRRTYKYKVFIFDGLKGMTNNEVFLATKLLTDNSKTILGT